jgi:predicted permease
MFSDIRFSLRLLRKHRAFAAVTLLTLAFCIGANSAIYSAVYALMLKPLPYPEPARIVEIYNGYPKAGLPKMASNIPQYQDYKEHTTSFSALGLWRSGPVMFGEDANAQRVWSASATTDLFDVLGLKPLIGQFFTLENSRPKADNVVVLTQSFWTSHFNEDPGVIGRTMRVDGNTLTIVGVAPRSLETFDARVRFVRPFVWDPARISPMGRHANYVQLYARLKPGTSIGQAQAESAVLEKRFNDAAPAQMRDFLDRSGAHTTVGIVQAERVQPMKSTLLMLEGGVVFVLLIGCVNIANLLLARTNGRQTELAIRFALGASRAAIARQLLVETAVLTGLGTVLGLGVAWSALQAMNHYREKLMAQSLPFALDGHVLAFTVGVAAAAALLISIIPIVHVIRANLAELIQRDSRGASASVGVRRLSSALIVGQVAIALILLTGAGLLIHSFMRAISVDPGFEPAGVVTGRVALPQSQRSSDQATQALRDRMEQTLKEIPGVDAVGLSTSTPFLGGIPINALTLANDTLPAGAPQPGAFIVTVSPEYFSALHIRLIEGRFLERGDAAPGHAVFVVDENFAKKYFAGKTAIGGRFTFGERPTKDADWPTIVGVVGNVPQNGVEERSGNPCVYRLLNGRQDGLTVFLRTARPTAEVIQLMREKLRVIDPGLALFDTGPLQNAIDTSFDQRRAVMLLLGFFAALALFLSAIGIYGVLAYDVSQRTREIGVRGAIGASYHQIIGLIMRQGLTKAVIGLIAGLLGAVFLSRAMRSLLFDVNAFDPLAYTTTAVALLVVAAAASYIPARRAARIDPIRALRDE